MLTGDTQQVIVYIILAIVAVVLVVRIVRRIKNKDSQCDTGCGCCSQHDCPARKTFEKR